MNTPHPRPPRERIAIVELLRGIAALSVAWFHFTNGNPRFLGDGSLKASGTYGWVGVDVFFVISGFIIPLAMYRGGYEASSYTRFVAKRLVRLEPPYLVCVLLTVALAYLSSWMPGFRGEAPAFTSAQLALHVGYLVGFSGYTWVSPVFWSLAIEFQYYLAIGFLFPWIAHRNAWVRVPVVLLLFGVSLLPLSPAMLPPYLGLFVLGMLTFHFHVGWLGRESYLVMMSILALLLGISRSPVVAIAAVGASLAIAFVRDAGLKPMLWLGTVSYSLYLLHVPIGGRIINLGERWAESPLSRVAFLAAAIAASLVAAALYYRLLERPAREWSARLRYGKSTRVAEERTDESPERRPSSVLPTAAARQ